MVKRKELIMEMNKLLIRISCISVMVLCLACQSSGPNTHNTCTTDDTYNLNDNCLVPLFVCNHGEVATSVTDLHTLLLILQYEEGYEDLCLQQLLQHIIQKDTLEISEESFLEWETIEEHIQGYVNYVNGKYSIDQLLVSCGPQRLLSIPEELPQELERYRWYVEEWVVAAYFFQGYLFARDCETGFVFLEHAPNQE